VRGSHAMILEYMLSPATAQLLDWCEMSGREDGIFALYRMPMKK
jgi:hypothetical protein